MNIWFWVQTWVDVDFLAVGKLTKTTFPMAYEAEKGRLTFSFYVIKRFTQIFVKVNQKMKKIWHFLQSLVWTIALNGHLDKFRTWISLHLPKEAFNALRKIQFTIGTNFWNTL